MTKCFNNLGQPIGAAVTEWTTPLTLDRRTLKGRYTKVEALDNATHGAQLFEANMLDQEHRIWTYLPYGPFEQLQDYQNWVEEMQQQSDPCFYAIVDYKTNQAIGVASYLRINPNAGSIEVGHINFSPAAQQTIAATEAMYLMMKNAFNLGYRRYEWKCDALNQGSRRAALRLGFTFEGVFRQATIYKNRNRDTAWYAVIDKDWPDLNAAFQQWLDPSNFDPDGKQHISLSTLTKQTRLIADQ